MKEQKIIEIYLYSSTSLSNDELERTIKEYNKCGWYVVQMCSSGTSSKLYVLLEKENENNGICKLNG